MDHYFGIKKFSFGGLAGKEFSSEAFEARRGILGVRSKKARERKKAQLNVQERARRSPLRSVTRESFK